jgi:hypothetical protein
MAKRKRITEAEIRAQIPAARARERAERRAGLRARSVAFDRRRKVLRLELTNGTFIGLPQQAIPALQQLSPREVSTVTLSSSGDTVEWAGLDIHLSVPGLLLAAFDRTQVLRELARIAGSARSDAKALAARRNGRRGGRPRSAVSREND